MSILEFIGLITVVLFVIIFLYWIVWVTEKIIWIEKRQNRQDEINHYFKLKNKYKEQD